MNTPSEQLSVDDILSVLSNVQRRKLLESLLADSPPDGGTTADVPADDVEMRHVHLPKLADHGLVDWDRETDEVTRGPNFEAAEEILGFLAEHDDVLPPGEVSL